jgi:hypothetical protein
MRAWRKKTGPSESSLMAIAAHARTGRESISSAKDRLTSMVRLNTNSSQPKSLVPQSESGFAVASEIAQAGVGDVIQRVLPRGSLPQRPLPFTVQFDFPLATHTNS